MVVAKVKRLEKYKDWVVGHKCSDEEMNEIMENARKNLENFNEEEKEALVQGIEFILDYGEKPAFEDYKVYEMIIAERAERSKNNGAN